MHCPKNDKLCRRLQAISRSTWIDLWAAHLHQTSLGEESITDYLVLDLRRHLKAQTRIRKFCKVHEEPRSGSDWIWFFLNKTNMNYFAVTIQAKKISSKSSSRHYRALGRYDGIKASQLASQIHYTNSLPFGPAAPFYAFYNNPFFFEPQKPLVLPEPVKKKNIRIRGGDKTQGNRDCDLGITIINSHQLRVIQRGKSVPQKQYPFIRPWWHLACQCRGNGDAQGKLLGMCENLEIKNGLLEADGFLERFFKDPFLDRNELRDYFQLFGGGKYKPKFAMITEVSDD